MKRTAWSFRFGIPWLKKENHHTYRLFLKPYLRVVEWPWSGWQIQLYTRNRIYKYEHWYKK